MLYCLTERESLCSKAYVKVSEVPPPGTGVLLENEETKLAVGLFLSEGSRAASWARARGTKWTWMVAREV